MVQLIDVEATMRGEVGSRTTRETIKRLPGPLREKVELTLRAENAALLDFEATNGRPPTDREYKALCQKIALEMNGVSMSQIKSLLKAPGAAILKALRK